MNISTTLRLGELTQCESLLVVPGKIIANRDLQFGKILRNLDSEQINLDLPSKFYPH